MPQACFRKKKEVALALGWALFFWILPFSLRALDSSVATPPASLSAASTSNASSCSYYFIDTYDGAVLPGGSGSSAAPTGTAIALKFYNNVYNSTQQKAVSTPTNASTPVPCAGTYQLVFTIELQANTNVSTIVVAPLVQDTQGTTLYPPATASSTVTLYPQCNNSSYSLPYCTVGWISGSVQVQLPINDQVLAPILTTGSSVTVLGGHFEIIYLHS